MKSIIKHPFLPIVAWIFLVTGTYAQEQTCIKPLAVPDKWIENQTPPYSADDTFDLVDSKGNPLPNPDVYIPFGQADYTGYTEQDFGSELVLKAGDGTIAPGWYLPVALGDGRGANDFRSNISNCNAAVVDVLDLVVAEPGNMTGPTRQGIEELINQDPNAFWNAQTNRVEGSAYPVSPRVVTMPLFDPEYYDVGKQNGRNADLKVANFIGFFVEGFNEDGDIIGRITRPVELRLIEDCGNGSDDDGDGAIDCDDAECANDPGCDVPR